MTWLEALILGFIQGLTEFLPVSSSGHLELVTILLGVKNTNNLLFAVVVHLATTLSTIVVFRKDLYAILVELLKFRYNETYAFFIKILISMVPVGIVGVFFNDQIEALFNGNLMLIGFSLFFTSLLLFTSYFKNNTNQSVTFTKAMLIGLAQAVAVLPGVSRSGSTITMALLLNIKREEAVRFSFLMAIIPIMGAGLLKFKDYIEMSPSETIRLPITSVLVGFFTAFLTGVFACKLMIKIVNQGKLIYFAIYCFIIGLIAVVFA